MTSALEHGTEDTPGRLGAVLRAVGDARPCALGRHGPWVATTLAQARQVLTDPSSYDFPVDVSRRRVRRGELRGRSPHEVIAPIRRQHASEAADLLLAELDAVLDEVDGGSCDAMQLLRRPVARSTVRAVLPDLEREARHDVADAVLGWVDSLGPVISGARPPRRWSSDRRAEHHAKARLEGLLNDLGTPAPVRDATVLAAGTQVPIAAGAWVLVALAERPSLQDQLVSGAVEPISVVWEVLRLVPPTWITARVARRDVVLAGVHVPEGGVVLVSPLLLGRLEALVPAGRGQDGRDQRGDLDATRWKGGEVRPGAWLPFGAGPHACPGRSVGLAQLEAITSWAGGRHPRLTGPAQLDQSRGIFPRPAPIAVRGVSEQMGGAR